MPLPYQWSCLLFYGRSISAFYIVLALTITAELTSELFLKCARHCAGSAPTRTPISKQTTNMITIMMVPLAVVIICYALFTFYMRSKFMERKQVCHLLLRSCTCRH